MRPRSLPHPPLPHLLRALAPLPTGTPARRSAARLCRARAAWPRRGGDLPVRRRRRAAPRLCTGRRDGAAGERRGREGRGGLPAEKVQQMSRERQAAALSLSRPTTGCAPSPPLAVHRVSPVASAPPVAHGWGRGHGSLCIHAQRCCRHSHGCCCCCCRRRRPGGRRPRPLGGRGDAVSYGSGQEQCGPA